MITNSKLTGRFLLLTAIIAMLCSCATIGQSQSGNVIPILSLDELTRPYTKIGRIQITREVLGADYVITPDITSWGLGAIRQEAEKMGADAIISPEVTGRTTTYNIFPSTEFRATGFAIKFK